MNILEGELISGAGGGKGGGGHTPVEASDTLRSQQVVKLLLAVGEGEIQSIDDVLLNKVSISNYKASWSYNTGTASQAVIQGFIDTEAPYTLSATPIQNKDSITNIVKPVGTYTWSFNGTVDAVRLTLTLASLRQLLDNGDLVGYSVSFNIYSKATLSSNFSLDTITTKTGKASSNYSWDIIVKRPNTTASTDSWQVAIERTTADDASTKYSSITSITAITQIYYKQLTYPNTSLVYIEIKDAVQFGGQVPAVLIKGKGRKVLIPSNYNPTTRVYTGIWDLGMNPVKQFTSNIAWVIYDVLRDSSCLGLDSSEVDRVSFYQLSKYSDELVPDGYGGTIPRYTAGYQYYTRQNVQTFLQNLLSLCNANLTTNEFGQVAIIFDQPNISPSRLVTNSNVVGGIFNYSSNDLENRYSLVNVTYNNFKSYSETDTATWSDDSLISRYGLQTNDILLPGCINEAQAIRKARWAVYTNAITTRLLTFNLGFEALSYKTGSVIKVMDSDNADVIQHGIIKESSLVTSTTTFTLDKSITLANTAYTITFYLADGVTLVTRTIFQTNTTVSSISFTGTDVPLIGSTFILSSTVVPQLYKVVGITKNDTDYTISCIVHDEAKFTYIDGAVSLTSPANDFVNVTKFTVEPVTNLTITPVSFTTGTLSNIQLHISWDWNLTGTAAYHATYEASWSRDNQDTLYISNIEGQSFDINSVVPGSYTINVWSINPISGIKSTITSIVYNYRTSAGTSGLFPPINPRVAGTSYAAGTISYSTSALALAFDYNTANNAVIADSLLDYVVELWDSAGTTLIRSYIVQPDISSNGLFNLPLMENISAFGSATRTYQLKLYSRDLTGFVSSALSVAVNNPVPATASFSIISGVSSVYINVTSVSEIDVTGYQVYRSATNNFVIGTTADALLPVYDGPDTYITLNVPDTNTWYYKVAAYDSFSKTGLNFSSQQSSTALSIDATKWSLSGITFSIGATNRIDWTAGSIVKNGSTTYTIAAGNATWTTGTLYVYFNPTVPAALQTTTTLGIAVAQGCYPLATYDGGDATHIKGGDGSAFISGSQLIAGTVGASQLVAGTAVITGTAQLGSAVINDVLTSTNFNATTHTGWNLNRAGDITTYGTLKIMDSAGNVVLSSGSTPSMDFSYIGGTTKPANNATKTLVYSQATVPASPNEGDVWFVSGPLAGYVIGAIYMYKSATWIRTADATVSQLGGTGVNILDPRYATFEEDTLPPFNFTGGTLSQDTAIKYFGTKSLKMTTTINGNYCVGNTGYSTNIQPNSKWIISGYVYSNTAIAAPSWGTAGVHIGIHTPAAYYGTGYYDGVTPTLSIPANTWTRIYSVLDLTADSSTSCVLRIDSHVAGTTVWFDGIMLEAQVGNLITPSPYQEPINFLTTYNKLPANTNLVTSLNTWSIITGATIGSPTGVNAQYAINRVFVNFPAGTSNLIASPLLSLAVSTDYTVSFTAWSLTVGDRIDVDLNTSGYGNLAGATSFVNLTAVPTVYSFIFNSTDTHITSCNLRFFSGYIGGFTAGAIKLCNVKFELGSTKTSWSANSADLVTSSNPITASTISTYIANAAIGAAQIGSMNLTGLSTFASPPANSVIMDSKGMRVYDASGVLRVKLGNLA